jgi:hypothetical protein
MLKTISGTYDLIPDSSWIDIQTEEIRLVCDTTSAPVVINLPLIASIMKGTLNVKIYIVDGGNAGAGNASVNNITVFADGTNKIGAANSYVINQNNGGAYIQLANPSSWLLTPNSVMSGSGAGGYSWNGGSGSADPAILFLPQQYILQPSLTVTGLNTIYASGVSVTNGADTSAACLNLYLPDLEQIFTNWLTIDAPSPLITEIKDIFPKLKTLIADTFNILNVNYSDITLLKLETIKASSSNTGSVVIDNCPNLVSINLPALTTLNYDANGVVAISNNPMLQTIAIPNFVNGGNVTVFNVVNCGAITTNLNWATVLINNASYVVAGGFQVDNCVGITNAAWQTFFSTANITIKSAVGIVNNSLLQTISHACSAIGSLSLDGNTLLTSVLLPNLASVNSLGALGAINTVSLVTLTVSASLSCVNVNFFGCSLDQASVDNMLSALDTGGAINGNVDLSGGANAIPTGGGANPNTLSLLGKGWTVTTN